MVLTLANDVIGTGPRLQFLTDDPDANRRIERAFARWSQAVGLAEKLRTMRIARAQDGEAFAVFASNPKLSTAVRLDIRLVEADQVTTPEPRELTERSVDGIVFDPFGNPVEYHVSKDHPGSDWLADQLKQYASRPVVYRRGAEDRTLQAPLGRTLMKLDDGDGGVGWSGPTGTSSSTPLT
ncbi:MAG: phage portal protein [Nitrospira sp.]|nr:phage portal protein [Nitrospira sp.]